jgi:5S rRNA maturation endonuclease (ribonuclease M5)
MQPHSATILRNTNGNGPSLEDVLSLLKNAKSDGRGGYKALCPAHDDHNPSLSITRGDKQGFIAKCHAGCPQKDVLDALGLSARSHSDEPTTNYEYHDENGTVLYRVVRRGSGQGKTFYQQKADGRGGWVNSMQGARRVPFGLPELIEAIAEDRRIYVVEGEKDVQTAKEYGLIATTNAGGAGKWGDELSSHLRDADVVIFPDNDTPGRDHADKVARSLNGVARSVRVVNLTRLQEKGDLTDWLCEGGSLEELERLVGATSLWSPKLEASTEIARPTPHALRALLERPELMLPPPALIPNIAYQGRVTLLSAREKAGKSTLVGQGVAALSRGGHFLNEQLQPGRVLWYPIDEPAGDTVRRLQLFGADPDSVIIQTERPTADELRAEILATNAKLVVIDTLGELWSGRITSARDAEEVGPYLRPFVVVARETNCALVLLYHTTKSGAEYRDSVQIGASVDIILTLRMPGIKSEADGGEWDTGREDDGRRVLDGRGRGGINVKVRLAFDGTRYNMGDAPMPLRSRVLNELTYGPASGNSLVSVLKARRDTVLSELRTLSAEGLVEQTRDGQKISFALTARGAAGQTGHPVPAPKYLSQTREPPKPETVVSPLRRVTNTQVDAFKVVPESTDSETTGTTPLEAA